MPKTRKRNKKKNNKNTTSETDSRRKNTANDPKQEIVLHPEDIIPNSLIPYMMYQQDIDSWTLDTTKARSAGQLSRSVKDKNLGTYTHIHTHTHTHTQNTDTH